MFLGFATLSTSVSYISINLTFVFGAIELQEELVDSSLIGDVDILQLKKINM